MPDLAITFEDVFAAAARLRGVAHRTPVLTSRTADARWLAEMPSDMPFDGKRMFWGGFDPLLDTAGT